MTKIRVIMFAALAVIVAFGVTGQALAQDSVANPHIHVATLGTVRVPHANIPDATTALNQGITAMGVAAPLDASSLDEWPCFGDEPSQANAADCSSIAAGGIVLGIPVQNWSLANCTNSSTGCGGQIYWTFEDDSTTGTLYVSITVKQGSTIIFGTGSVKLGTIKGAPGTIEVISDDGIAFLGAGSGSCATGITCGTAVSGPATITVATTIYTSKTVKVSIAGSAVINLE